MGHQEKFNTMPKGKGAGAYHRTATDQTTPPISESRCAHTHTHTWRHTTTHCEKSLHTVTEVPPPKISWSSALVPRPCQDKNIIYIYTFANIKSTVASRGGHSNNINEYNI